MAYYRQLYDIERELKDASDEERRTARQERALPIWKQFGEWVAKQKAETLPKSAIGLALAYASNHWEALVRYTEAGFLAIDNNVAEREMKRIAIGRKNWLFCGSDQGGARHSGPRVLCVYLH